MPTRERVLSPSDARRLVAEQAFGNGRATHDSLTGIEIEWLAVCLEDPARPAPFEMVQAVAQSCEMPGLSRVSFEPGGQVELSSAPLPRLDACEAVARDARVLGRELARVGVGLVALGLEPGPRRERVVRTPRYDAMERYFATYGDEGAVMMRSTAAMQVNVDLGGPEETERRWRAAHELSPVLAASFANSPFNGDGPSGWHSTRLAVWSSIDHGRTRAAYDGSPCRVSWSEYALASNVMLVRTSDGTHVPLDGRLRLADWVAEGHALGWPTPDDLMYHATTLFPPVRPRGHLELRVLDAVPDPWWRAAVAVTAALVSVPELEPQITGALAATRGRLEDAARWGLDHPDFAAAAEVCFDAALGALAALGADADTIAVTEDFVDRYVSQHRCPADDRLDAWRDHGALLPRPDNLGAA